MTHALSALIPYRAPRSSWRARLARYTAALWDELPHVQTCWASDGGRHPEPFNFARAANRARSMAHTGRLLIVGADAIPPTGPELWRIHRGLDAHPWLMVYAGRHTFSPDTTRALLSRGRLDDPLLAEPDGARLDVCHGVLALRADVWDAVGGMDESYRGWGYEDLALERTLLERFPDGWPTGVGYQRELWHPPAPRAQLARNKRLYQRGATITGPTTEERQRL